MEVVLRLLRGEDLGEVSREVQVPPPELEAWRRLFVEGGLEGLRRRRGGPLERELERTRAEVGQLTMRLQLAQGLLEKKGIRGRAEEALQARAAVSPGTGRRYPLSLVCEVYRLARSSVYAALRRGTEAAEVAVAPPRKRGPRTEWLPEELVEAIRDGPRSQPRLEGGRWSVRAHGARPQHQRRCEAPAPACWCYVRPSQS